ncbi:MAG: hypothetical protein OEV08_06355 [Nitrospira sp.]|nr:hypothetical protein [Nitrospira sp.]
MAADATDDFQKELVDLFVLEAHEWLQNIHVALDELQQGPGPERHAKLIEIISAGVTNLGGSAATINLPDVERASFQTIPFIEALRDPQKSFSVQDFLSLCKQLGQIHEALTHATGISFADDGSAEATESTSASLSTQDFLRSLGELQQQFSGAASGRNLIRSMMEQMEGQVQAGVESIDASVIQDYLARVAESEETFLKEIDVQVPEIANTIRVLGTEEGETPMQREALASSLHEVTRLRAEAQQVNAGMAMMFLTGLHSLLTVVTERHVVLAASRVEAVSARLDAIVGVIRQWVERGRTERAAISQLLPAG